MTNRTARTLSSVFMVLAILCVLGVCGTCCLNSQKGEYGPEEVYSRGDGTFGYGAKYYNSSRDQSLLIAIIGGTCFLAFSFASVFFLKRAERSEYALTPAPRTLAGDTSSFIPPDTVSISPDDPMLMNSLKVVVSKRKASTALLQQHLDLDYTVAASLISALWREGYIGDIAEGTNARPILPKAYERLWEDDTSD